MNVGDETTTTQMILDLTEVHFINLEIQLERKYRRLKLGGGHVYDRSSV
jgi:hypothetical protein